MKQIACCAILLGLTAQVTRGADNAIFVKQQDLHGARYLSGEYWEVGFAGGSLWQKSAGIADAIQGIAFVRGDRWNVDKLELPGLHVTADAYFTGSRDALKSESGAEIKIFTESQLLDSSLLDADQDGFFALSNCSAAKGMAIIPATYFDLPAGAVRQGMCLSLVYAGREQEQAASFRLDAEYAAPDGGARIGFLNVNVPFDWFITRSCYIIQAGGGRGRVIGRIPMDAIPYAGGLDISAQPEKLLVRSGSIRIEKTDIPEFQKSAKLIWPGHIYHTANDFNAYELSLLGNLVPLFPTDFEWVPVALWDKYPAAVEILKGKAQQLQQGIDALHKYGVAVLLGITSENARPHPEMLQKEYPQFVRKKLTEKGEFVPAAGYGGLLDEANPDAMRFLETEFGALLKRLLRDPDYFDCQPEARFFQPYNYLKYPFYSQAALDNYRQYCGNPQARFPTAATIPETERTFNAPAAADWQKYFEWRTKVHTDFFISWAKAGWNAFHDSPYYKGAAAEDGAFVAVDDQPHGVDLERLFAAPHIKLFIAEYPKSKDDPYYRIWIKHARKYGKQHINLFDANMIFPPEFRKIWLESRNSASREDMPKYAAQLRQDMQAMENILAELFVSAGVDLDTDGYACCGMSAFNYWTYPSFMRKFGGPVSHGVWRVWQALIRKHYGFGAMELGEAESVLEAVEKNKPVIRIDPDKKKAPVIPARAIVIDGADGDWDFTTAQIVNSPAQAGQFKDWGGTADASFKFHIAADDASLYFGILVQDDTVLLRDQLDPCPRSPWSDEIDVFITTVDIRETAAIWREKNAHQLRLIPGERQIWHTQAAPIDGSAAAWRKTAAGYFIEGRLPLECLKFQPAPGMWIGLDVQMLDADSPADGCRGSLFWNSRARPEPLNWGVGIFK